MRLLLAVLLVVLLLLQYRLWLGDGGLVEVWQLQHSIALQKAESARQAEQNRALQAEVKDLKQGLEAVEERARSELGMVKRGESFFHIIEDPPEHIREGVPEGAREEPRDAPE